MRLDKIKELLKEIRELSWHEYISLLILNEKIDYNSDIQDITDGDLDYIRGWIENTYMENDISLYSEMFNDFINKEEKMINENVKNLNDIKGVGIAYDGCHKIYVCEDEDDIKKMKEYGYNIYPMSDLKSIWENSCGLRFVENAKLTKSFVAQFEEV